MVTTIRTYEFKSDNDRAGTRPREFHAYPKTISQFRVRSRIRCDERRYYANRYYYRIFYRFKKERFVVPTLL